MIEEFNITPTVRTTRSIPPMPEYKPKKMLTDEKRRNTVGCLRRNTIDMLNRDYIDLGVVAYKNLFEYVTKKEKWAIELYYKSVFSTLFSKEWLNSVNVSGIANFKVNSAEDINKLINSLLSALLESGNGTASSTDVKDAIKILTTMKTDNDQVMNSLASSLTDTQLKAINSIVNTKEEVVKNNEFDF